MWGVLSRYLVFMPFLVGSGVVIGATAGETAVRTSTDAPIHDTAAALFAKDMHALTASTDAHANVSPARKNGKSAEDSDGDGMWDDWELCFELNPLEDDREDDPDLDGLTNIDEYMYSLTTYGGAVLLRTFSSTGTVSGAFSPDGSRIVSGHWFEEFNICAYAKLWDVSTGERLQTFCDHTWTVTALAFSPDGATVLTGSGDSTAKLWDAETGTLLHTLSGHTFNVSSVDFAPDGTQVLTGSLDDTAKLWDVTSGAEVRTFSGHSADVHSACFSPDGTQVLTASNDKTAKLWDATTGAELRTFSGYDACVMSACFSPDGTAVLIGACDGVARLWDVATGEEIRAFAGHSAELSSVDYSPDGHQILTGSMDGTARLWDAATGGEITFFPVANSVPPEVCFSPDGRQVLTAAFDPQLWTWRPDCVDSLNPREPDTDGDSMPDDYEIDNGLNPIVDDGEEDADLDGATNAEEYAEGTQPGNWDTDEDGMSDGWELCFDLNPLSDDASLDPDEDGLTNDEEYRYSAENNGYTVKLRSFKLPSVIHASSVALAPTASHLVVGSDNGMCYIWDYQVGLQVLELSAHSDTVSAVSYSRDGMSIVTGSVDNTAKLWDATTGAELVTFTGHTAAVNSVAFSPDGNLIATASQDHMARLWNSATGEEVRTLIGHTEPVASIAFSPDGTRVLTGSLDSTAILWDTLAGIPIRSLDDHWAGIWDVAFSPDGTRILAGAADGSAVLWDVSSEVLPKVYHISLLQSPQEFSDSGRLVLSTTFHGAVLWSASTGAELHSFSGQLGEVGLFSSSNSEVITVSFGDGEVALWSWRPECTPSLDPNNSDTDVDGMPDGYEVHNETNPLVPDADEDLDDDGASNLTEFNAGSRANDPDSDDDTISDGWEIHWGTDPLVGDQDADPDSDGFSNAEEYDLGSDPHDSADPPDTVHVSPSGSDETGDGSLANPWASIGRAMTFVARYSERLPVLVQAGPGAYAETVDFVPSVSLRGDSSADPEATIIAPSATQLAGEIAIEMNASCALRDLMVLLPFDAPIGVTCVRINDVPGLVRNTVLNGRDVSGSVALNVLGPNSAASVVADNLVMRFDKGLRAVETTVTVEGNIWENIGFDGVFVSNPDKGAGLTPVLGDAGRGAGGGNTFRNIGGYFIRNGSGEEMLAELNDWDLYSESEIAERMSGPVDFVPFLHMGAAQAVLTCDVVALETQAAVAGASVGVVPGIAEPVQTNAAGEAQFTLMEGQFMVMVTADGFDVAVVPVVLTGGENNLLIELAPDSWTPPLSGEGEGEGHDRPSIQGGGLYELGEPLTLSIYFPNAVGVVAYEWYKDGESLSVYGATYAIEFLAYEDSGKYTCMLTDESAKGLFIAGPVTVTVVENLSVCNLLCIVLGSVILATIAAAYSRKQSQQ